VENRAVLPAVISMQILAAALSREYPERCIDSVYDAFFPRFLVLPQGGGNMDLVSTFEVCHDDSVSASLLTRCRRRSITRYLEHAKCRFGPADKRPHPPAKAIQKLRRAVSFDVDPQRIYNELVPFGKAFQNIVSPARLTAAGGTADIHAGQGGDDLFRPLGPPFLLDAAFHLACVWGQWHTGFVTFPVAIRRRVLFGNRLSCRRCCAVALYQGGRSDSGTRLFFDIWILNGAHKPVEAALGVEMLDVSGGRRKPPQWIRRDSG